MVGCIAGAIIVLISGEWATLDFSNQPSLEINPLDIVSLLVTIFLAVYVAQTLNRKNDLERSEKAIFINLIDDFRGKLNTRISSLIEKREFDSHEVNLSCKVLRMRLNSILNAIKESGFLTGNEEFYIKPREAMQEIWETLTVVPKKSDRDESTSHEDQIKLKIMTIEQELVKIDIQLVKLIMHINRGIK